MSRDLSATSNLGAPVVVEYARLEVQIPFPGWSLVLAKYRVYQNRGPYAMTLKFGNLFAYTHSQKYNLLTIRASNGTYCPMLFLKLRHSRLVIDLCRYDSC